MPRNATISVPDDLWRAAGERATAEGTTRTEWIRRGLETWVDGRRQMLLRVEVWDRFAAAAAARGVELEAYMDELSRTAAAGVDPPMGG